MAERVRVLCLIKGLGLGGAERLLVAAAPYLDRERFDYHVGYLLPWKNALAPDLEAVDLRVNCLGSGRGMGWQSLGCLNRYLRENQIHVLHAHLPWAGIVGRLAARKARVPAVLYTEHGCWNRLHPLTRWANRATLAMNDLTIAVSDEVRQSIHGVQAGRITTIANGIDCRGFQQVRDERAVVLKEYGIPPDHFVIVSVANLTAVKNHSLLIRAFARFTATGRGASLVLVGQLRERTEAIRKLVRELDLRNRVVITGPRTDVPRIVKAADAFALSSLSEGLPVSLLEAMALGKPVVCTCVGGIPGVVSDGLEGFLVPTDPPQEMADRFARLHDDPQLRYRMGRAGQETASTKYDVAAMVRRVEAEYRRILEEKQEKVGTG